MKRSFALILIATTTAALSTPFTIAAGAQGAAAAPAGVPAKVEVRGGTATFEAGTNVPAINVHGRSTELKGQATLREAGGAITLEHMEATVLVKTLTTGLGLRDEHMRKYIFTTNDGQVPDLTFVGDNASCSAGTGGESTCKVLGQLGIRGTTRPFTIALKVSKAGDGYRAAGEGTMKLSAYGIAQPSQFGVTATDDVKVHLEFTAKPLPAQMASRSGDSR